MKYIFKNIKSFARDYAKIFVLMIVTIMASTLIIHLSYGMFREYKERKELSRSATNEIVFRLKSSYISGAEANADAGGSLTVVGDLNNQKYEKYDDVQDLTAADIKKFAKEVDQEVAGKLLNIHTGILEGEYRFDTDFLIDHGKIVNSGDYGPDSLYNYQIGTTTGNIFQYGRYFSDREYAEGDKVCIMYGSQKKPEGDYLKKNMTKSGTVMIGGDEYEIIGLQRGIGTGFLPITAVGEDAVLLDEIDMRFKDNISLREINLLIRAAEKCFGDRAECNYDLQETENNAYLYNTVLLLVLVVSMVAAFNFCALYHYIVTTRQRTLKIFRICGLSHSKSILLYLGECSVLSAGTYLVTLLLFRYLLMPFLAGRWNVFDFHFPVGVYGTLFLIFFVSSFVLQFVMIRWTLKKKMIR